MKKVNLIKQVFATTLALPILLSATSAYASTTYINSVGSEKNDINILENESYSVVGKDTTQNKKSEYTTITYADEAITSECEVYATIEEGSKVHDPENPDADPEGFVDGSILVGVPTVLIMDGTPNENGEYVAQGKGKVKGNIAGTTIINIVPEDSFTMSQPGKADIEATVEQNYKRFVVPTSTVTGEDVNKFVTPTFNDKAVFDVSVKTNEATAGSWNGSFNYTISTSTAE